jgi:UDP-glucose 4-epimerase
MAGPTLFLGPLFPRSLPSRIPALPAHPRPRFRALRTDDVADPYRRAIVGDARGPFMSQRSP